MIYLVSNIHRSGSSMMMRCLEAGGLVPVYDKDADKMNDSSPEDYVPNPNGFYQFGYDIGEGFTGYDGKLIKCPIGKLLTLPPHQYKVVIPKRNPAEIRASMNKWTPYKSWGRQEIITYLYDWYINKIINECNVRGDMDITVLNYSDIVTNPLLEFNKLSHWGINVEMAASMVQPELYRLKLEEI